MDKTIESRRNDVKRSSIHPADAYALRQAMAALAQEIAETCSQPHEGAPNGPGMWSTTAAQVESRCDSLSRLGQLLTRVVSEEEGGAQRCLLLARRDGDAEAQG